MLETKIKDHRFPPKDKLARPELDPKTREECYKIFNDVWYDFDEENGQEIKKTKYLQLMEYVKQYKKITPGAEGPFSDEQLEADW